eukprot:12408742-Karenia_brevis.AAC.1
MSRSAARNIFPLPLLESHFHKPRASLSRSVKRRLMRTHHWVDWANAGISSLNEIFGSSCSLADKPSLAQSKCLQSTAEAYKSIGGPPPDTAGALRALCGQSVLYSHSRSDVMPYDQDKISWPDGGHSALGLFEGLPPADVH